jgi:hypothetical protein
MDYEKKETFDYFLEKIVCLEIENLKLDKRNTELENIHLGSQEVIKNLKLEITLMRNNIK